MSDPAAHAQDATYFHFPEFLGGEVGLPMVGIQITKYMVIELFVAAAMLAIFIPLARMIQDGKPVKGRFWNFWEVLLVYMRKEVFAVMGKKDGNRFLPYIWMLFFFVLFCNLFGMLPWMGSPTGSIATTCILAICSFCVATYAGMRHNGPVKFWTGLVPGMELPLVLAIFLKPMLFVIELVAYFIKFGVLAIRLWANMFAGHVVLAVFLGFIAAAAAQSLAVWSGVAALSVFASVCFSLLELFVAFLQAYIIAFLSAIFISGAVHQH
ncbi:MAG TPA: ATP synthase F0 subunit A [Planctomycetaceae bacterium]|nr:ATP synthase F0 subunit A [Planctomycetaceae bacterium]